MKVGVRSAAGQTFYWLWCPACDGAVMISDQWSWNGDAEKPTFTPSLKSQIGADICHSFVTDGVWHFLADCTHDMAGQQVPMVDLPDWLLS